MLNSTQSIPNQTTVFDVIPYATYCGVQAAVGVVKRVLEFPALFCRVNVPTSKLTERFCYPKQFTKLDQTACHTPILSKVLTQVNTIKNRMKIAKEVVVVVDNEPGNDGACLGSVHSLTPIVIVINIGALLLPKEELDFLIAHELSHAVHKDGLKTCFKSACILATEVAASYFFTPWAIPLIEIASAPLCWWSCRQAEQAADLRALQILETSEGAVAIMQRAIDSNLETARTRNMHDRISPEGNDRHRIFHPPLTQRLRYCQEWKKS